MTGARASSTPEWIAALWPPDRSCVTSRTFGWRAISPRTTSPEPSSDPSSTAITSTSSSAQAERISAISAPMFSASFFMGMTTEICTMALFLTAKVAGVQRFSRAEPDRNDIRQGPARARAEDVI